MNDVMKMMLKKLNAVKLRAFTLIEMKDSKTLYNFHKITMDLLVTLTLLIKARAMAFC